eukprot:TRINITY_DN12863_c0_g1_i3.p1 TRINITY_DN12863_c0_g1~~TRINITY_DN12863_c0_g1_i3.p1  ORF type:complete len:225 (+),score=23.54 TRINITY_DN12863_c0_g1_i3:26-676(+)
MKKNRCPPYTNGCGSGKPHFDIAAPGFDNLQWSTANVCGERNGTGFRNKQQSEALGKWYDSCADTAECADLCDKLEPDFRKGCKLFASWGWKRGDPEGVTFRAVECPAAFVKHIRGLFDKDGVTAAGSSPTSTGPIPASTPVVNSGADPSPTPDSSPTNTVPIPASTPVVNGGADPSPAPDSSPTNTVPIPASTPVSGVIKCNGRSRGWRRSKPRS